MSERENTQFLRRVLFLGVFQLLLIAILLGRMYSLQILEGQYYRLLAEGNCIATRPLIPLRGQLYDRKGVPLAHNETSFRLVLLTDKRDKIAETLEILSSLLPLSEEETEDVLKTYY